MLTTLSFGVSDRQWFQERCDLEAYVKKQDMELKKEIKMKVTIIGSIHSSKETIKYVNAWLREHGVDVLYQPTDETLQNQPLIKIQKTCIRAISNSDLVIAIPKIIRFDEDGSIDQTVCFGESTSYEIAIAKAFMVQVVIWCDYFSIA